MATPLQASFEAPPIPALPQHILLVENSRAFTTVLRDALEQRLGLSVSVASTLAEAGELLDRREGWFLVLTGLVLADGDRDRVVDYFVGCGLPTIVVSGVYDEGLRKRVLQQEIIDYVLKNTPGSVDYLVWLVQRLERNRRITALVVDDSLSARTHAAALLGMYGYRVTEAAEGESALRALETDPSIRLVIVDQEMPGMDGVELTRRLRAVRARDKVAVIGISGSSDASLIPRFLKNGANDFLRKPFSREEFFCRVSQNVDQLELIGTLQDLATRDFLTGLPNRRSFLESSQRQLENARGTVTVAMVDIDHFKHINDSFGHEAGDQAIRAVAAVLQAHTGPDGISARFGGEEFCVLVNGMDDAQSAAYFEQMRGAVEAMRVRIGDESLCMTVSIGVTRAEAGEGNLHLLITEADRQLYLAKADGRNRVRSARIPGSHAGRPLLRAGGQCC